jgi:DNA repair exonuclease SbcCD ATPase subunit
VIIRRVHVRRFRKLADQVLECSAGLNIICGRNDAGKSTLHAAICAALFPIRPSEARTYGPWGEDRPGEIAIEFEADGRAYRLHKDFASQKTALTCGATCWDTPKEVTEEVGRLLGLRSLALFRATAHVGQWDLAAVEKEQQEIGTRLVRIMTGGDSDADRIRKALDEKIRHMEVGLRGVAKTPGPLKAGEDRVARLAAEQQRLGGEVAQIEQAAAERDRLAAQIADLDRQVRDDEALLEANRCLRELDRRCEELGRRAAELRDLLDRIDGASRDLEQAGSHAAQAPAPAEPEALRALTAAAVRAEVLEREAEALAAASGAVPAAEVPEPDGPSRGARARTPGGPGAESHGPRRARAAYGTAAALAAATAGAGFLLGHSPAWGAGLLLAVVLLGSAALLAYRRQARAAVDAEILARQRDEQARRLAARRDEARDARDEVQRQLRALGASSVEDALDRQERWLEARRRQESARQVLEGLLGGRSRSAVAEEYQRVLVDLGAARAQRDAPDLGLRRLDPAAFQRLQADAGRRRRDLEDARAHLQRLEGRLLGRSPHEDLARVEEELEEARARLARARRQVEVLRLTRDVLAQAYDEIVALGKDRLEQLAGEYLRALSGGAYERLRVDKQTLAPQVWVGPPKEWAEVAAREIGSGGVDQCYLALRLGLVDLLSEDRRPPLFLDDPFLAYDEHRQAAAMALLRRLAGERQIFLFTCRSVYGAYADCLQMLGEVGAAVQ